MTQANARSVGSIPETYHAHLRPLLFEAHAADLAAQLTLPAGSGSRVLELAAGTDILTRLLRSGVRGGASQL